MLLYLWFVFGLLSRVFLTTSSGLFDCHLAELLQFDHFSLSKSNNPLLSCLGKIGTVNFQTQIVTNLSLKSSIKSQDVEWMNSRNAWQSLFKLLYICFIFSYKQYCSMP